MRPDARLVAVEIDAGLARLLMERFDDPRLQVVCGSAEDLAKHLDGDLADVLVCALPFTSSDAFQNLVYGRVCQAGLNPFVAPPTDLGPGDASLAIMAVARQSRQVVRMHNRAAKKAAKRAEEVLPH